MLGTPGLLHQQEGYNQQRLWLLTLEALAERAPAAPLAPLA